MTTYEKLSIAVTCVQVGLITWYGWETFKLRRDAGEQNKLMAEQLKVMADGLQFQRECIEQEDEPALDLSVVSFASDAHSVCVQNIKENVHFMEFRSNDPLLKQSVNESHIRRFSTTKEPGHNVYLAIVYRTYRGKVKHKVYRYFTADTLKQIVEDNSIGENYRSWPIVT